jgi:Alginate lyase
MGPHLVHMSDGRIVALSGRTWLRSLSRESMRTRLAALAVIAVGVAGLVGCGGEPAKTSGGPLASSPGLAQSHPFGCPGTVEPGSPRLYGMDPGIWSSDLQKARADPGWKALTTLRKDAAKAFNAGPWTVTTAPNLAPGGDPHQYVTLSRYWWPNPSTANGLPFVRRDGQTDPLVARYPDETYLDQTVAAVSTLVHAYALLGDQSAAGRAAVLLRTFFIDPATAMAPDADFAQLAPGQTQSRGDGVLDTRVLIRLVDDLRLLHGSSAWTPADNTAITHWLASFLDWLQTSPVGKAAKAEPNNHGTWYDAEVASLALYLGRPEAAQQIVEHYVADQEPKQIGRDGSQPLELARPDSWEYSTFNLDAAMVLSLDARYVGIDLFSCTPNGAGSIAAALAYLLPFATGVQTWIHQESGELDLSRATLPAEVAAAAFQDRAAAAALARIPAGEESEMDGLNPARLAYIGHTP